ncbi:Alpha/Beta hydrolase fold [Hyaloscypha variabilis]
MLPFSSLIHLLSKQDDQDITPKVNVRVYTPKTKPSFSHPVGVFGHGGGFCGGDLNFDDKTTRYVAENVPCIVISIDYRLSPTVKYPTMVDDFETVFDWVSISALVF